MAVEIDAAPQRLLLLTDPGEDAATSLRTPCSPSWKAWGDYADISTAPRAEKPTRYRLTATRLDTVSA